MAQGLVKVSFLPFIILPVFAQNSYELRIPQVGCSLHGHNVLVMITSLLLAQVIDCDKPGELRVPSLKTEPPIPNHIVAALTILELSRGLY